MQSVLLTRAWVQRAWRERTCRPPPERQGAMRGLAAHGASPAADLVVGRAVRHEGEHKVGGRPFAQARTVHEALQQGPQRLARSRGTSPLSVAPGAAALAGPRRPRCPRPASAASSGTGNRLGGCSPARGALQGQPAATATPSTRRKADPAAGQWRGSRGGLGSPESAVSPTPVRRLDGMFAHRCRHGNRPRSCRCTAATRAGRSTPPEPVHWPGRLVGRTGVGSVRP
jgi:hypothetical protein